jgi:hypothetical protein
MIAKQDPGMNFPPRLLAKLLESAHKNAAIGFIAKAALSPIAPPEDMVKGPKMLRILRGILRVKQPPRTVKICPLTPMSLTPMSLTPMSLTPMSLPLTPMSLPYEPARASWPALRFCAFFRRISSFQKKSLSPSQ